MITSPCHKILGGQGDRYAPTYCPCKQREWQGHFGCDKSGTKNDAPKEKLENVKTENLTHVQDEAGHKRFLKAKHQRPLTCKISAKCSLS